MQTRTRVLLLAVLLIASWSRSGHCLEEEKKLPVTVWKSWEGIDAIQLREAQPKIGYIANKKEWEKLWQLYQDKEPPPAVDFDREMILVAVNNDMNHISVVPEVDKQGDMSLMYRSTLALFPNSTTCRYQFALIKRDAFKTLRGKEVPAP